MYESMLLPTDGNRDIAPVVDHAVALAKLFDATLHVLHVVDERAYLTIPPDARDRIRDILKADGESFTKTIAERAINENITVHRDLRWGDPATGILTAAVEHDIDLIVMGTHGRTGYERYALGSVAERVVRSAPSPSSRSQLEIPASKPMTSKPHWLLDPCPQKIPVLVTARTTTRRKKPPTATGQLLPPANNTPLEDPSDQESDSGTL